MELMVLKGSNRIFGIIASIFLVIFLIGVAVYLFWSDIRTEKELSSDFDIALPDGNETTLRSFQDGPVLLHFTSIENPICMECENELEAQVAEIEKASREIDDLTIITINMRKNQYSDPGIELVKEWWGINVTWIWIEDPDPFLISGKFVDYWSVGSESANPTLLLLDKDQYIVGIYHVYQMGKGVVDGVQTSAEIAEKVDKLQRGDWEGVEGQVSSIGGGSYAGMFVLGIITSFSPCSIALLFTVFTFIVSSKAKKEQLPGTEGGGQSAKEGFLIGIAFVLGMALIFFVLGLFIAKLGVFLQGARYFDLAAGMILILLGLNNLFQLTDHVGVIWGKVRKSKDGSSDDSSLKQGSILRIRNVFHRFPIAGAFLLGVFFSLGWAPCAVSLVLPVVVWILSQDISVLTGGLLFLVFGIGHGLLFIPLSVGSSSFSAKLTQRFVSLGKWVKIVFGVLVVAIGIVFALRIFDIRIW